MSNLFVFTTGNDLDTLKASAASVMITVHAYDCKWSDYVQVKLREGIRFLLKEIRHQEYAMWVDGHDTLIVQPESEILARLHAAGDPMIIAGEANCWPDSSLSDKYPAAPSPRFLNAGGFIGPFGAVLTAMHTALSHAETGDDQRAWTTAYLAGALPTVQIDHARRIFSCIGDGAEAMAADTCVKHFNGKIPGRDDYWKTRSAA